VNRTMDDDLNDSIEAKKSLIRKSHLRLQMLERMEQDRQEKFKSQLERLEKQRPRQHGGRYSSDNTASRLKF